MSHQLAILPYTISVLTGIHPGLLQDGNAFLKANLSRPWFGLFLMSSGEMFGP